MLVLLLFLCSCSCDCLCLCDKKCHFCSSSYTWYILHKYMLTDIGVCRGGGGLDY